MTSQEFNDAMFHEYTRTLADNDSLRQLLAIAVRKLNGKLVCTHKELREVPKGVVLVATDDRETVTFTVLGDNT